MPLEPQTSICDMSDEDLDKVRQRLIAVVEPLSDRCVLELADTLHDMLRRRRALRTRYPDRDTAAAAPPPP